MSAATPQIVRSPAERERRCLSTILFLLLLKVPLMIRVSRRVGLSPVDVDFCVALRPSVTLVTQYKLCSIHHVTPSPSLLLTIVSTLHPRPGALSQAHPMLRSDLIIHCRKSVSHSIANPPLFYLLMVQNERQIQHLDNAPVSVQISSPKICTTRALKSFPPKRESRRGFHAPLHSSSPSNSRATLTCAGYIQSCAEKRNCFAKHQPGVAGFGWMQPGRNFLST